VPVDDAVSSEHPVNPRLPKAAQLAISNTWRYSSSGSPGRSRSQSASDSHEHEHGHNGDNDSTVRRRKSKKRHAITAQREADQVETEVSPATASDLSRLHVVTPADSGHLTGRTAEASGDEDGNFVTGGAHGPVHYSGESLDRDPIAQQRGVGIARATATLTGRPPLHAGRMPKYTVFKSVGDVVSHYKLVEASLQANRLAALHASIAQPNEAVDGEDPHNAQNQQQQQRRHHSNAAAIKLGAAIRGAGLGAGHRLRLAPLRTITDASYEVSPT
jgi:hypothetical protein